MARVKERGPEPETVQAMMEAGIGVPRHIRQKARTTADNAAIKILADLGVEMAEGGGTEGAEKEEE